MANPRSEGYASALGMANPSNGSMLFIPTLNQWQRCGVYRSDWHEACEAVGLDENDMPTYERPWRNPEDVSNEEYASIWNTSVFDREDIDGFEDELLDETWFNERHNQHLIHELAVESIEIDHDIMFIEEAVRDLYEAKDKADVIICRWGFQYGALHAWKSFPDCWKLHRSTQYRAA
jgi:hypothetical protein